MRSLTAVAWALFWVYWAVSAARGRAVARAEGAPFYKLHGALLIVAFVLVMVRWPDNWPGLGTRFVRAGAWWPRIGLAVLLAGLALAVWARRHLGEYWSGQIAVKVGHKVIRTGPYAYARHPIYAGLLLGMAGTAIAHGQVAGLPAVAVVFATYAYKITREERLLLHEMGDEYALYRRQVSALVPFVF